MTWKNGIRSVDVRRTEDGMIKKITVSADRTSGGYKSYNRVEFDIEFDVDDNGCAFMTKLVGGGIAEDVVHIHHLGSLLPVVDDAVRVIPDVESVESVEHTLKHHRSS